MIVKYLDQTDQMRDIGNIDIPIRYYEDLKLNKKIIKNSWRVFIEDINQLKIHAYKNGIGEYYKETMKYSMTSGETRKIDTAWDLYSEEGNTLSYVQYPRTCYLKLAYLYRDLKRDGKFTFPTFMRSVYTKRGDLKIEQVSAFGKTLIQSEYFSDLGMDFFISTRGSGRGIEKFFDKFIQKTNKDSSETEFIVMLDKYSDINTDYYVYNIVEDSGSYNFYDDILETEDLWRFMYGLIVDSKLKCFDDYRVLLNQLVLGSQEFL